MIISIAVSAGERFKDKMLDHMTENLDLTGEQQTEIAQILDESHALIKELREELKVKENEIHEKIKLIREDAKIKLEAVLTIEQQERLRELKKKNKRPHDHFERVREEIDKILTEDQKKQIQEIKLNAKIDFLDDKLNLTDEQKAELKILFEAYIEKHMRDNEQYDRRDAKQEMDEALENILTKEQYKKLKKMEHKDKRDHKGGW